MKYLIFCVVLFFSNHLLAQQGFVCTGADGSATSGTVSLTVGQVDYVSASGTNGDANQGVQQPYEVYTVGVLDAFENISIQFYPNPSSDFLIIEGNFELNKNNSYSILDASGSVVQHGSLNQLKNTISISHLAAGLYFIQILKDSEQIDYTQIIKL